MPWVDLALIAVLVISTLVSVMRGFAKDAISLAAWILAFVVCIMLAEKFASILPDSMENPRLRVTVAVVTLFVLTLVMGMLANFMLAGFVNLTRAHSLDRGLGAVFGLARGIVIICLLAILGAFIGLNDSEWWGDSALLSLAEKLIASLAPYLPDSVARFIKL